MNSVDVASGFETCWLLDTKSSDSVVQGFDASWRVWAGAPVVLVTDAGPEFVSDTFARDCEGMGCLLRTTAVESPWQNGVEERHGGLLKAKLAAIVRQHLASGKADMKLAAAAATEAANRDIGASGYSAYQRILGRQPRIVGDVLAARGRITELGQAQFSRRTAMLETARAAQLRLRFSSRLRTAELKAAQTVPDSASFALGQLVYFWREVKTTTVRTQRSVALRRWHGPGVVVGIAGLSGVHIGYRGGVTKCSPERAGPPASWSNWRPPTGLIPSVSSSRTVASLASSLSAEPLVSLVSGATRPTPRSLCQWRSLRALAPPPSELRRVHQHRLLGLHLALPGAPHRQRRVQPPVRSR